VSQEELHVTKWNVHKCEESISTLQRALSDANILLHEERAQVLRLQTENEQLRIQELEDRRRIQHLLALTQPIASDVTFFKDCRPSTMTRFPGALPVSEQESAPGRDGMHQYSSHDNGLSLNVNMEPKVFTPGGNSHLQDDSTNIDRSHHENSRSAPKTKNNRASSRAVNISTCSNGSRSPANHSILKTVYLPNEKVDTLLLTIDNLRQELSQLKSQSKQQIDGLLNDRQLNMATNVEREQQFAESLRSLEGQLKDNKLKLTHMTKDYLLLRYNSQKTQRTACEQIEESKQVPSPFPW
jgi:coiled-coil domain-containing protein 77